MKWAGLACPFELYAGPPWDLSHGVRPSRQGFQGPAGALLRLIPNDTDARSPVRKDRGFFFVSDCMAGGRKPPGGAGVFPRGGCGRKAHIRRGGKRVDGCCRPLFLKTALAPARFIKGLLLIQDAAKRIPAGAGKIIFLRQLCSGMILLRGAQIFTACDPGFSACPVEKLAPGSVL